MIYRWLNNIKRKINLRRYGDCIDISSATRYSPSFALDIREPKKNKVFFSSGEESVLGGTFIFETQEGQIEIGKRVYIGNSTFISRKRIVIEDDVIIAWGCTIYDHNSHSIYWEERKNDVSTVYKNMTENEPFLKDKDWDCVRSEEIRICSKAWVGFGCTIMKGVTIGEGAVVGANSVVTHDVPPWSVVAGNPARVVKYSKIQTDISEK